MIKGIGVIAFMLFVGFSSQLASVQSTTSFSVMLILTFLAGLGSIYFFTVPEDYAEALAALKNPRAYSSKDLILNLAHLNQAMRQDGLLSLEGLRQGLRDPFLKMLIKKMMDGYVKADILGLLRNHAVRQAESLRMLEAFFERSITLVSLCGLLMTLFLVANGAPMSRVLLPFIFASLIQFVGTAVSGNYFESQKEETKLHFVLMEEGLSSMLDGQNADLLRDKLVARSQIEPKWKE